MTTRAKLRVESVKLSGDDGKGSHTHEEVQMRAVGKSGAYSENGLDEDNTYAKWTPSADFRMMIANPALFGQNTGLILLVFSFVCFTIATFNTPARWNLVAAGLAFWTAAELFGGLQRLIH